MSAFIPNGEKPVKYVICKVGDKEVPILMGNEIDLDAMVFPGEVIAAGIGVVQTMFVTCQGTQIIKGEAYGSRGLPDEILMRMSDFI